MSKNWPKDLEDMHSYYGFHEKIKDFDESQKMELLKFRYRFLKEELDELHDNLSNPEEVVDACIDLCVVAIGTLELFDIDIHEAWEEVHEANMSKRLGIKEGRPNPLGLPDLMKPEGWEPPSHKGNHGTLPRK